MPNQLVLSTDKDHLSVAPGTRGELNIQVQNLSTLLDQVTLDVQGIDPGWVQIIPQTLPVFAQGQAGARIVISPPLDPTISVAGIYPVSIHGVMQENKGQEAATAFDLEIQLTGDYRLQLDQARPNGKDTSFPIKIANEANALLELRFSCNDAASASWYKFDPYLVKVPPAGEGQALLTTRPRKLDKQQHIINFNLTAEGEFLPQSTVAIAASSQQASGQFVQAALPKEPARLGITLDPPTAELQIQIPAFASHKHAPTEKPVEATYAVTIGNSGELPAVVHLAGLAQDETLAFRFDPTELTLGPGSEGHSICHVTAIEKKQTVESVSQRVRELLKTYSEETKPFSVSALPVDAAVPAASAKAVLLVKLKRFPWAMVGAGVLGVCFALAVFGIFLVIILQRMMH